MCSFCALFLGPNPRVNYTRIKTCQLKTSMKSCVLNFQATVHYDIHARIDGSGCCFDIPQTQLRPKRLRSNSDCFFRDFRQIFSTSKHIDHVRNFWQFSQTCITRLTENFFDHWVYKIHLEICARTKQVSGDEVAWSCRVCRYADHRHALCAVKKR